MPVKSNMRTKVLGVPLQKSFQKDADGSLIVSGYFTSDGRDEIGDIITRGATERAVPKYRQWGNIRYMHQPRPVAKVIKIGEDDGLAWNETQIKVIDPQAVFEVENGLLTAMSVGILVNFDDIEMLEDGGWVINDYSLAEISLVDHPANYDARLKSMDVEQGLRYLARSYGLDNLAMGMEQMLNTELAMDKETITEEEIETPQEETEVAKSESSPEDGGMPENLDETQDVIEEKAAIDSDKEDAIETEQEEAPDVEELETKAIDAEEPVEESVELPEEEPTGEPSEELLEDAITPDEIRGMFEELSKSIGDLTASFAAFSKAAEAQTEVPEAMEQVEGDAEVDKAITAQDASDAPAVPVNRSGAVPETELPGDAGEEKEKSEQPTNLREALSKYLSSRNLH